ncbi:hypothetical protein Mp_3g08440 [Marchantia polymorpha subsp. ruderalis]|uniref:Uncharacterized protein n=2 Tax=Marchantia polymorpha TaxID=3197 RepID=A0AAF6AYN9_MARPO|nr:hypothetical protein MARPO_1263s0001 [Marchantia polymorpha]BBN04873.1 hypothetical protein Mp_3g08440 [Marchantia polymorpha subsp. ruderalis]|eukprot:PTQ26512.1 hypothetical protein MARPO_1263s0001 [Marchantia polymorpha]
MLIHGKGGAGVLVVYREGDRVVAVVVGQGTEGVAGEGRGGKAESRGSPDHSLDLDKFECALFPEKDEEGGAEELVVVVVAISWSGSRRETAESLWEKGPREQIAEGAVRGLWRARDRAFVDADYVDAGVAIDRDGDLVNETILVRKGSGGKS